MDNIWQIDISDFISNFYDKIYDAYNKDRKYEIDNDLKFFINYANTLNSLLTNENITNYTQSLLMDYNWNKEYLNCIKQ